MVEAVLFDLDQTLTDRQASIASYAQVFRGEFSDCLRCLPSEVASTIAKFDDLGYAPRSEVFEGLLNELDWVERPPLERLASHWSERFPWACVGRQALKETLAELGRMGLAVGVVTNGGSAGQLAKIEALGLVGHLGAVVISEAAGVRKPDPRIFVLAVDELGVDAERCVFVGDHPFNDVVGAQDAGLISVWFEGVQSWPSDVPGPVLRVSNLPEVIDLVTVLRSRSAS